VKDLKKTSVILLLVVLLFLLFLAYPVSAVGVFRNTTGNWSLDYNNTGSTDSTFHFGKTGDIPVVGDWNGDMTIDAGVFRPSTGTWYLDTTRTGVIASAFQFGKSGDVPVVGDWNGDMTIDIGVFRPSTGTWYLDTTRTGVIASSFQFGKSGDVPKALQLPSVAPAAAFTSDVLSGNAPLTVRFTSQSAGTAPLSYSWDFNNDGAEDSSSPSPDYVYTSPGIYTVNLTVSNGAGSDSELKAGYITVTPAPVPPVPAFTADVREGIVPLTVRFTSQSAGTAPLSYSWDFNNDGVEDSTTGNPTFTYHAPGTYTVKLTVINSVGNDSVIREGYITVNEVPVAPVANFFTNKRSGSAPLTVRFSDSSTGTAPLTYEWDFDNDGEEDSDSRDPTFTYISPGTYTVKLTVTNDVDTDIERKTDYITVTEAQPGGPYAGVALTFDDNTIDQWYEIRDLLQPYNAHVTFFVSQFEGLDEDQIDKLRTLKADGHEIAFHGTNHEDAALYLNNHSIQEYIDDEIIPGISLMENAGLTPVDFAYPYGSENDTLTAALQTYFIHIRGTQSRIDDPIYYEYGSNQLLIEGIGIDDQTYGNTLDDIYDGILTAKQEDKILIFYAHEPVQNVTGNYMISYDRIEKILINASEQDMKFYTVSELT
jgi:PKD repeat protein